MPQNLSRWLLGTAALAVVLASGGCKDKNDTPGNSGGGGGGTGGSGDTILVGEYGSMTGSEATFGKSMDDGIKLAVEEFNKGGGLNGKKVAIAGPEDTESVAQKSETAVKRLVDKKVVVVLGEIASGASKAGGPICQDNKIPMITPASTNPTVTEIGDYIFRVCFIDSVQGPAMAKFAREDLKAQTAAIFYDQGQPYSTGLRDEFKKSFEERGGKIVGEATYTKDDRDFNAPLTRIKAANPDVIYVPGYYTQTGAISKQARSLGIQSPLLGGDGWDSDKYFESAGTDVVNCYFTNHAAYDDPNPKVQAFVSAYKAKYNGKEPDSMAILGYDAAMVAFDAMKRAKSLSGPDLRDAIAATKDFDGVSGKISINSHRDADKSVVIQEVANGKFRFKTRIDKI